MADEISVITRLKVTNGKFVSDLNPGTIKVTQAAIGAHAPIVVVGTSEEDLSVGDVSTLGWLMLRNLDSANYVTYGPKSAGSMVAFGRIEAGEPALLRLNPGITLRWQANTASVKVQVLLLED